MYPFDESAAQFRPPRAEEPANLRREIVEELSDHLTCARRREQMAGGAQNEEAVRRRVLDRFGDPAAVARKLWLDWMWERIMTQRILIATCVLMVVISCVALGLAWASLNRQEDLIATWQSTSEKQMGDQQKLFERLLAQSERLLATGSAGASPSIEWNPVDLKFVLDKPGGAPLPGVQVRLRNLAKDSGIPTLDGKSDERGVVRFERVHYGNYELDVTTPGDESISLPMTQRPGESLSQTIVCPGQSTERPNVIARIEWPKDLAEKPLWFRFALQSVRRPLADQQWRGSWSLPGNYVHSFLIEPNGTVHGVRSYLEASQDNSFFSRGGRGRLRLDVQKSPLPVIRWDKLAADQTQEYPSGIRWPGSGHEVGALEVLIPVPNIATMDELRSQELQSDSGATRFPAGLFRIQRLFFARHLGSADWPHRIEPGTADKPSTLWLTPTGEAVETIRTAVVEAEKAREAGEQARAEYEKALADRGDRRQPEKSVPNDAPDDEKKNVPNAK